MDSIYLFLCTSVLVWLSIQDFKTMQLHPSVILLLAAINVWHMFMTRQFVSHFIAAFIAFALLWMASNTSKQQLGMGDVYIVAILFLGIGAEAAMQLLLISACGVVVLAIIMRLVTIIWKENIPYRNMPFLPFISLSFMVTNYF